MTAVKPTLEQLCVNSIRTLSIDAVQKADSGHPGLPLGAAPMAFALWQHHLNFSPAHPTWCNRDRFVLSAGHGSMLLYSLLHLYGFDVTLEDLRSFRQWGSRTPGHPEVGVTAGVEATTGPLGQGTGNAVGFAIAERALAHRFNRPGHEIIDHHTFALVSDGDLMEGIASEAASLAGHLKLGRLIFLYDSNDVSLDGPLKLSFSENLSRKFEAMGWHVQRVENGDDDVGGIARAIAAAKAEAGRPSLIEIKTTIGFGSPHKAGKSAAHGSPLGAEEVALTKQALGWTGSEPFQVPTEAREEFARRAGQGDMRQEQWQGRFEAYQAEYPEEARQLLAALQGDLPADLDADLPVFPVGERLATRAAGGKVLSAFSRRLPTLIGGDADLSSSTNTMLPDTGLFDGATGAGRNIKFGIREHAMAAAANGMALHGGVRPFTATFFCFADYMRPSIRLAALSELPVVFVFTHDSIGVGEDGPTHQPIEHLMSLRAMPHLAVVRPADAHEVREAWRYALERKHGPTALVLSRQALPTLAETDRGDGVSRGGYVLRDAKGTPELILLATGSEVEVTLAAAEVLTREGIKVRVVSMPCFLAFEAQDAAYREEVLPRKVTARVSIEAGATLGWERYVGLSGACIGLDRFGASAPGPTNFEKLGFHAEHIAATARKVLKGSR